MTHGDLNEADHAGIESGVSSSVMEPKRDIHLGMIPGVRERRISSRRLGFAATKRTFISILRRGVEDLKSSATDPCQRSADTVQRISRAPRFLHRDLDSYVWTPTAPP